MKKTALEKLTLRSTKKAWTAQELADAKPKVAKTRRSKRSQVRSPDGFYVTTRVPEDEIGELPFSAVGKLVFYQDGVPYVGSAWVCARAGLFTAAHNLYDEGHPSSNVVFYPQYSDGPSELGSARVTTAWVPKVWYDEADQFYDMASGVLDRNLGDQTGILQYTVNRPVVKEENFRAVGYPDADIPDHKYQGKYMWMSTGSLEAGGAESVIIMSSDFCEGSSGGPWLAGDDKANGTTFRTNPEPDYDLFSTYFDDLATALVDAVS